MKILFVIDQLDCGGAEQQLITLCKGLKRFGHEPHVITIYERNNLRGELDAIQVPVQVAAKYGWLDLTVVWRLKRLIDKATPDLVHAYLSGACTLTPMTKWIGATAPILQSERNIEVWRRGVRLCLDKFVRRRVVGITCNAHIIKERLVEVEGVPSEKIVVIHNGLGIDRCSRPSKAAIDLARRHIGAPEGATIVICVANLNWRKSHDILIRAFFEARKRLGNLFLLLIGSGELEIQVRKLIDELRISGSSRLITDCTNPLPFLCASNIAILTSIVEGCSNALLEAMAMGLPIIASDAGGNSELVAHGQGGYLCPIGDVDCFANTLIRLAAEPKQWISMGQYNVRQVTEKFSMDIMIARTIELYESILGSNMSHFPPLLHQAVRVRS